MSDVVEFCKSLHCKEPECVAVAFAEVQATAPVMATALSTQHSAVAVAVAEVQATALVMATALSTQHSAVTWALGRHLS